MALSYVLTRAAKLDTLSAFRDFIARVCAPLTIDSQTVFDLQLAVDEAATNVIRHGYAGVDPGSLMLELRPQPTRIVTILTDFGHPFEPTEAHAPDVNAVLQDRPMTGFGLYFIYQTMDAPFACRAGLVPGDCTHGRVDRDSWSD